MSETKNDSSNSLPSGMNVIGLEDRNVKDFLSASLTLYDVLLKAQTTNQPGLLEPYDPIEDFKWFVSAHVDVSSYRQKYIAIWKKKIVGSGESAIEAERLAKAYYGEDCHPAIVYIPEDEAAILL